MIAVRSGGLPAIALSSSDGWKAAWAQLLAGGYVTIVPDADEPGCPAAPASLLAS